MLSDMLRQQHGELGGLLAGFAKAISGGRPGTDLRRLLIELNVKLTIHLAAEDNMVYPQLQAAIDPAVAALAKRFASEMGGLSNVWKGFLRRYPDGAAIDADRPAFAAAFTGIATVIGARVRAEEQDLYTALDRMHKA